MKAKDVTKLIGAKVRAVRNERGLSLRDLGHITGISFPQISDLERGEVRFNVETLSKIAMALDVEATDLFPPLRRGPKRRENQDIQKILEGHQPPQQIPVVSKTAAGDPMQYTDGDYPAGFADEMIDRPHGLTDPNAFALRLKGDSMEPRFPDGTLVFCSPSLRVENGQPVVVKIEDEATTCKIYHRKADQIVLCSINHKHLPIVIHASKVKWVYRVKKSQRDEE